jgi:hypothetical protein
MTIIGKVARSTRFDSADDPLHQFSTMPDQSSFQFQPSDLDKARRPGLSGFMRIRNGEDWLALSIESHLPYFDEIVAVYNDCSDRTPQILEDLAKRFPDKIRVVHYEPVVHPSNSDLHIRTPASSVHSIVNYYNFSLAQTTRTIATKLDDDHLAIPAQWQAMRDLLAGKQFRLGNEMPCFSGINLVHTNDGLKIHATVPLAGQGDHWFFEVAPGRYFVKDRRYEHFNRKGLKLFLYRVYLLAPEISQEGPWIRQLQARDEPELQVP